MGGTKKELENTKNHLFMVFVNVNIRVYFAGYSFIAIITRGLIRSLKQHLSVPTNGGICVMLFVIETLSTTSTIASVASGANKEECFLPHNIEVIMT